MMAVSTKPSSGEAIFEITIGNAIANNFLWLLKSNRGCNLKKFLDFKFMRAQLTYFMRLVIFTCLGGALLGHGAFYSETDLKSENKQPKAAPQVTLLMYHHVSETAPRSTSVTPDELRSHLTYLTENNFNIVNLPTALAGIQGKIPLPDKAVVITFDDAYQDIFTQGRPILNEFKVPWALFVTTDPIGEIPGEYMSWTQVKTLHEEGVFIGNHSQDHAHLPRRNKDESESQWQQRVLDNIENAQRTLENKLGQLPKVFAYPYGEYDNALKNLLKEAGYIAFGQHSGGVGYTTDKQAIPRFAAAGIYANLDTLRTKMAALAFDLADVSYPDTLVNTPNAPTLKLTFNQLDFHPNQFQCFAGGKAYPAQWLSKYEVEFKTEEKLPIGRSRYNCTAPSIDKPGRYYWFSIQWILADQSGSWPD